MQLRLRTSDISASGAKRAERHLRRFCILAQADGEFLDVLLPRADATTNVIAKVRKFARKGAKFEVVKLT